MCEISKELETDLETLNSLIRADKPFSIVSDSGIFTVDNRNDELIKILLQERKVRMAQQIKLSREEIQWDLI